MMYPKIEEWCNKHNINTEAAEELDNIVDAIASASYEQGEDDGYAAGSDEGYADGYAVGKGECD